MTDVYLRDITNMVFVNLHLNVSSLSVCSSSLHGNMRGSKSEKKIEEGFMVSN